MLLLLEFIEFGPAATAPCCIHRNDRKHDGERIMQAWCSQNQPINHQYVVMLAMTKVIGVNTVATERRKKVNLRAVVLTTTTKYCLRIRRKWESLMKSMPHAIYSSVVLTDECDQNSVKSAQRGLDCGADVLFCTIDSIHLLNLNVRDLRIVMFPESLRVPQWKYDQMMRAENIIADLKYIKSDLLVYGMHDDNVYDFIDRPIVLGRLWESTNVEIVEKEEGEWDSADDSSDEIKIQ